MRQCGSSVTSLPGPPGSGPPPQSEFGEPRSNGQTPSVDEKAKEPSAC